MEYAGNLKGLLCPVRAIREYLSRTRDCRSRCSCLFVAVPEPQHVVHPHTISHWICQVIKRAHEDISEEDTRLVPVKAHEVRAVVMSALFDRLTRQFDIHISLATHPVKSAASLPGGSVNRRYPVPRLPLIGQIPYSR
ncbi:hypothetical protein E2C01_071167 [Portunus trituberculatus]|uniref:Uncharacterized protein n=1 Tax=Portunus trituberculatus TaxID=210409 RepID=A0A5B7I797_PORTR|nr:hypothetical protein [Portunus trituberculatus]